MSSNVVKIPVIVIPTSIIFYLQSRSTHKQILTIYNPYDFPVKFKVLCNAQHKYCVQDPEGSIGPQLCVDILIRHTSPSSANCNVTDKFRITMQDFSSSQILGKRDIEAKLMPGEKESISTDADNFQNPSSDRSSTVSDQRNVEVLPRSYAAPQCTLFVIIGILCVVGLFLPTIGDREPTSIPPFLHISLNFKLGLAFALGLLTMVVLRP